MITTHMVIAVIVIVIAEIINYLKVHSKRSIPRIIWTYWHNKSSMPGIIKKCIGTWAKHNPGYRIEILDEARVFELCGVDLKSLKIAKGFYARYADFARLLVVAKYGGIWMDATTICTAPLEWVHEIYAQQHCDIIGFYSPHTSNMKYPILENSFFAAPRNSKFIADWLAEATRMSLEFETEEQYADHVKTVMGIDMQHLEASLPYLSMHLCTIVIQNRTNYSIWMADVQKGPMKYLAKHGWDVKKSLESLCIDVDVMFPIIKLRGVERHYLDNNSIKCNGTPNTDVALVLSIKS